LGSQVSLERHIFGLLNKTRHNLMKDGNHKNRFDINAKKVLRAARAYYDHKLELVFGFKKLRRKISRSHCLDPSLNKGFVHYMDLLTEQVFQDELLQLFKVSRESMSNHLAALVCPKAFQSELDLLADQFQQEQQPPHIKRMATINSLATKSRDLLYQYNKEKLNSFMDTIENLLIVESFLLMQGLFGQIDETQTTNAKVGNKRSFSDAILRQINENVQAIDAECYNTREKHPDEMVYALQKGNAGGNAMLGSDGDSEPINSQMNDKDYAAKQKKLVDDFKAFSFSFWKICKQRIEKLLVQINQPQQVILPNSVNKFLTTPALKPQL
jgi:hypothetical protein